MFLVISTASLIAFGEVQAPAQDNTEIIFDKRIGQRIVKGQLLVTLHETIKAEQLKPVFERLQAKFEIGRSVPGANQFVIATEHERLPELRQRLANHPFVASAGYNVILRRRQLLPNDPVLKPLDDADDWNLHRIPPWTCPPCQPSWAHGLDSAHDRY